MRIGSTFLVACLMLSSASATWAQKPENGTPKPANHPPPSPPSKHTEPDRPPRVPRANPVKPEQAAKPEKTRLDRTSVQARAEASKAPAPSQEAVARKMPVVFWPSPMTIHLGEPLAGALSGASADVPGTFTYSPGLSYIPQRGSCAVSVDFHPSDPTHYSSASALVVVTVQ